MKQFRLELLEEDGVREAVGSLDEISEEIKEELDKDSGVKPLPWQHHYHMKNTNPDGPVERDARVLAEQRREQQSHEDGNK